MARSLKELEKEIMRQDNRFEDWTRLDKEVDEAMLQSTEAEIDAFVESGAGEILDMTCSAIRNIQKNQ